MHRMGWLFLVAALFLAGRAEWRLAPSNTGTVTTLDGGTGQPPPRP
jgi:hypothetical protein